jgi:hypothetical protein
MGPPPGGSADPFAQLPITRLLRDLADTDIEIIRHDRLGGVLHEPDVVCREQLSAQIVNELRAGRIGRPSFGTDTTRFWR